MCLETPVPKAEESVALSTAAEDQHFLNAERIWLHASFLQGHRALKLESSSGVCLGQVPVQSRAVECLGPF